jgi:hypothetical protein
MKRTRQTVLASLLVALTVALGYALAAIPNVELMTITVFLSGYLLGMRLGMVVGGASMVLHSLFNPLGAALPPLMAAQVAAFVVIALAGAWIAPVLHAMRHRTVEIVAAGISGFLLTLFYDIATSAAAYVVAMDSGSTLTIWRFIAGGALFMIMHQVWNTGLFLIVLPPALNILDGYRDELMQGR